MIYTIGSQKLTITHSETKEAKGTPNQVVGWRDMAETCKTLDAVCKHIDVKNPFIVDGIARAGFWGVLFRHIWPNCKLHLNEKDETCMNVLHRNFPNDTITNLDTKEWAPKKCDIVMLDFDDFTLRKLKKWKGILENWDKSSKYLIFVDSACFGFKFGNLKHYGVNTEKEYFNLLNETLGEFMNKEITVISKFVNAATILMEPKKGISIKYVDATPDLFLAKGDVVWGEKKKRNPGQQSFDF